MNKKPYSSAIKKTPYKYPIAKKIGGLMLDGLDYDEVFRRCFSDNYIEIESEQRRREITNVLYNQLSCLDEYLLSFFYKGDVATSKFILVYAIAIAWILSSLILRMKTKSAKCSSAFRMAQL